MSESDEPQANPTGPILDYQDLAELLRLPGPDAARVFARKHLDAARITEFGRSVRYCRSTVLRLLNVPKPGI